MTASRAVGALALTAGVVSAGAGRPAAAAAERSIVILVPALDDDRLEPARDAIAFWNETLAEVGAATRLGDPTVVVGVPRPVESYARVIAQRAGRLPVPAHLEPDVPVAFHRLEADIVLLLSQQDIMSFAWPLPRLEPDRHLVVIRKVRRLARGDPMVSRHVVAHELGHTFGLGHNDAAHTLMCGPCQPLTAASDARGFLPLTAGERARLRALAPGPPAAATSPGRSRAHSRRQRPRRRRASPRCAPPRST